MEDQKEMKKFCRKALPYPVGQPRRGRARFMAEGVLVFSLHYAEWWDCRKCWSSEGP